MPIYETRELHRKEELRTRWFQGTYDDLREGIFDTAEYLGYVLIDVNDRYQEFLFDGPADLIIKVSSFGQYEQGVDLTITTRTFIDFGKGKRMIAQFYDVLSRHVRLKGVSLHP